MRNFIPILVNGPFIETLERMLQRCSRALGISIQHETSEYCELTLDGGVTLQSSVRGTTEQSKVNLSRDGKLHVYLRTFPSVRLHAVA